MSNHRKKATTCADSNSAAVFVLIILHKQNMFEYWTCPTCKYVDRSLIMPNNTTRPLELNVTWMFSHMEFKPNNILFICSVSKISQFRKTLKWSVKAEFLSVRMLFV